MTYKTSIWHVQHDDEIWTEEGEHVCACRDETIAEWIVEQHNNNLSREFAIGDKVKASSDVLGVSISVGSIGTVTDIVYERITVDFGEILSAFGNHLGPGWKMGSKELNLI